MPTRQRRVELQVIEPDIVDQVDGVAIREREAHIALRSYVVRVMLTLYGVTIIGTLSLLLLAGLGIADYSDQILLALIAVFAGEIGVGAVVTIIVKNLFPTA